MSDPSERVVLHAARGFGLNSEWHLVPGATPAHATSAAVALCGRKPGAAGIVEDVAYVVGRKCGKCWTKARQERWV